MKIVEEVRMINKYMDVHAAEMLTFPHCTNKEKNDLSQYCNFPVTFVLNYARLSLYIRTINFRIFCALKFRKKRKKWFSCMMLFSDQLHNDPRLKIQNGRGNLSFLMIGNSYTFSTGELVRTHFIDHYERMSTRSAPCMIELWIIVSSHFANFFASLVWECAN